MTRYTVTLNDELGPLKMNATRAKFAGGVSAFGSRAGHLLIRTTATRRFTAIHNISGLLQDPQATALSRFQACSRSAARSMSRCGRSASATPARGAEP